MTPYLSEAGPSPWSAWPDEDLLVEYARSDAREPFEELVRRYERPLYNYLRKFLGDAGLAEDAFQATFLAVHLRRREFDPRRQFRPWVYRIAATRAIDLFRKNRRHSRVSLAAARPGHDPGANGRALLDWPDARALPPSHQLEATEEREKLGRLVESLPARLRDVLVLIILRGLAYQAAADTLGIPVGTVKTRMYQARLYLRRSIVAVA